MTPATGWGPLLDDVRRLVTREPSLKVVLAGVARHLVGALDVDGCLIYRIEPGGEVVVAAGHPSSAGEGEPLRLAPGFGVTGRVAADGIAVTLVDDNPRNARHRELLGLAEGQRVSRLCVPARAPDGSCAAVVAAHSRTRRVFLDAEVALAQQVADLVALRLRLDRLTAASADHRTEWNVFVAGTVTAQEAERRRIAGDLHDGVSQVIASLTFHLSAAELALADHDLAYVTDQVHAARALAELAVAETRSAITGLHSPVLDDLGLAAGLESMARAVPNLKVAVDAQDVDLPEHVAVSLFRIAQEAIQNAVKHAGASKAQVRLARHGRKVVLTVSDDGHGFPARTGRAGRPSGTGFGLAGMTERAELIGGHLDVVSVAGKGTTVEVVVPIEG
ncbi:MAG: GAF domain-containing sensor histidine kinase [Mycobacteriales bacterium]